MEENTVKKKKMKGISIKTLNYIMILVAVVLYIFILRSIFGISDKYQALVDSTEDYINCEKDGALVNQGSDILTENVRLFVVTGEKGHMDAYFKEAYEDKKRDEALEALEQFHPGDEVHQYMALAVDVSNELMNREFYAMRLVAEANQMDIGSLPEQIQNVSLSAQDREMDAEDKIEKAEDMVFGVEYKSAKTRIQDNINYSLTTILNETRNEQIASAESLKHEIEKQRLLISILVVMNIIVFIIISILIVKPLQIYINCIKENKMLETVGAYEFKYLALTYNNIYEINAANEVMLRNKAEKDALTGLLNRGAFDSLRTGLQANACALALLLIDVDKFKNINDTYGHDVGDKVLKKVANVLNMHFRSNDFIARIGGDEFSVIMMDIKNISKDTIEGKIMDMNRVLKSGTDGLPKITLSVGVAFSEIGFHKELYKMADTALYKVKENGRCGCAFYEE